MPTHGPNSVSDAGNSEMMQNYVPPLQDPGQAAAAEAAFYSTLSGMQDIVPSAAAVNGWLTQARPERQLLDHFLSMPDGEFEGIAMGWSSMPGSNTGQGQRAYDTGESSWYDIPGTGNNHLPGFGGW